MKARQRGLTTVEFAVVGLVLMVIVFGVIEFARFMWVANALTEVTRRAARVATVCPVNDPLSGQVGLFADEFGGSIVNGVTSDNILIEYLDEGGSAVAVPGRSDAGFEAAFMRIRYVRSRLVNYEHELIIPLVLPTIPMPGFDAVLPRESLGITREGEFCRA
ncbi:MAG: TadE/TadG family type IV pilus assembly protein [Steroidobacteraceae bacterium]